MTETKPAIRSQKGLAVHSGKMPTNQAGGTRQWVTLQPFYASSPQHGYFLKFFFSLLIILCLASLGSLSLAPTGAAQTPRPGSPAQGSPALTFTEGTCTATAQYIPSPAASGVAAKQTDTTAFTSILAIIGRTQQDVPFAQACAAEFVAYYESFDTRHPKTFEAATFMLSQAAKQTFYLGGTDRKVDNHMDPKWRMNLQMVKQVAQVSLPKVIASQYSNGQIFASLDVPYQAILTKSDGTTQTKNALMQVTLKAIPPDPKNGGTGWNVESWQDQ